MPSGRYGTRRIDRCSVLVASCKAPKCRHLASAHAVSARRTPWSSSSSSQRKHNTQIITFRVDVRYFLLYIEKLWFCLSAQVWLDPWTLLCWPDAESYLFGGGRGMILGFRSKFFAYGQGLSRSIHRFRMRRESCNCVLVSSFTSLKLWVTKVTASSSNYFLWFVLLFE